MNALIMVYVTVLGAMVGSFLNVVIARLPAGESVVRPRSRCPQCKRAIAWYDNIPIVSYLLLRGRCRGCATRISVRYPLVELLMACLAAALFVRFGISYDLLVWFPLTAALLAITFLDIDHWWVPDVITFPGMVFAFATAFLPGGISPQASLWGLVPALLLWAIAWVFLKVTGREGLGFGDIKLLALLGLALGALGGITVLMLAAVQGAIVGTVVLLTGGHGGARASASSEDQKTHEDQSAPERANEQTNGDGGAKADEGSGGGNGRTAEQAKADHAIEDDDDADDDGDDDDEDDWQPPPHAIPFGPFLVLAALEVVFFPEVLGRLPERLSDLFMGMLG